MLPVSILWWPSVVDRGTPREQVLRLAQVCKSYNIGRTSEMEVLHRIDLVLERQEFVALIGPSGSGKSTLLNIVGLLDRPTSGTLFINGQATDQLNDADLTELRSRSIGFVFQQSLLLSAFTAIENVMMPMLVGQHFPDERMHTRAHALLIEMGLGEWEDNLANNLSGGQQQRVAIARALAMNPTIILADEPTGNLDSKSADVVFELMRKANRDNGTTFLIVTHNTDLAGRCDRIVEVVDGRIVVH